jgi:hypothetical protein
MIFETVKGSLHRTSPTPTMKAADAKTSRRAQCGGIYSYLSPVDEMWKLN